MPPLSDHAVTEEMVLNHRRIFIDGLLSCTSSLAVALYFCGPPLSASSTLSDGHSVDLSTRFGGDREYEPTVDDLDVLRDDTLALRLCSGSSFAVDSSRYFECRWISDFPMESECLFVGGERPLAIRSILSPSRCFDYGPYLEAVDIAKNMVRGSWCYGNYALKRRDIVLRVLSTERADGEIPEYIERVIERFRESVVEMDINHEAMVRDHKEGTLWQRGYRFAKHLFYGDGDGGKRSIWREIEDVELQRFCELFPNLKRIFIRNIELSDLFMETVLRFLATKGSGNVMKHKVEEIAVYDIRESVNAEHRVTVEEYVQKYWQRFDDINFRVHRQCVYNEFLCFHREHIHGVLDLW